jgi:hypothetical protein
VIAMEIIEIDISERTRESASEYAKKLGSLSRSITSGEGNAAGFIGKCAVADFLEVKLVTESFNYNVMYGGRRAAIKTKRSKKFPEPEYECSVTADSAKQQDCEIYIFVRVTPDLKKAWILGWYPKLAYLKDAEFVSAGTVDVRNGFVAQADCYSMEIAKLHPLKKHLIDV